MIQFNDWPGVRLVGENNRGKATGKNILRWKFLKFEKYSCYLLIPSSTENIKIVKVYEGTESKVLH